MTTTAKPRPLRSPMFLSPAAFLRATEDLAPREVGALVLIASWFWAEGRVPEGVDLGACLGIRRSRAEALMPTLRPFFERGGLFDILRGAALAKRNRRSRAGQKGAAALHGKGGARDGRPTART